ncbi:conserved hypothetical protein, secreted [Candidatus Magnetomorum sp. HK-1]|nr:conserved hypothetical protein, secreted [Candidatus Magnetomorum sp. HK-1]
MYNKYQLYSLITFFLLISLCITPSVACDLNYSSSHHMTTEDSILGLKLLTGHNVQITPLRQWDIDHNDQVHIPEILYPLSIQAKMITYEIQNNGACKYLINAGNFFGFIENQLNGHCVFLFPDGHSDHETFRWKIAPFLSETRQTEVETNITNTDISVSMFGGLYDQNQMKGSFNLNLSFEYDAINLKVSGNGNLQIATYMSNINEPIPLFLFDVIYLANQVYYAKIQGVGNNAFVIPWWPEESPNMTSDGATMLQMSIFHKNIEPPTSPNLEIILSTFQTPIYFSGINEPVSETSASDEKILIRPFIKIPAGQNQYNVNISWEFRL